MWLIPLGLKKFEGVKIQKALLGGTPFVFGPSAQNTLVKSVWNYFLLKNSLTSSVGTTSVLKM